MTKQEYIEQLQDWVEHNKITNEKDLPTQFVNEDGTTEQIEIYEDILSPIEYNICDRCGSLEPAEEACWVDYLDLDDEKDKKVYDELQKEDIFFEPCMICPECYHELAQKGDEK